MMIQIQGLKFRYPNQTEDVLSIPALNIGKGEKIFLFGQSGTGKSTLLEILSGLQVAQSGKVLIEGQDLTPLPMNLRDQLRSEKIGFIFQSFNLVPFLTVKENIELPFYFQAKSEKPESPLTERHPLLVTLGIEKLLDRKVRQLSVGQQQRVAVARAFYKKPKILLADEPTSALDSDNRELFLKLMFDLAQKDQTTIVFVSHDKSLTKLFDRTIDLAQLQKGEAR